MSSAYWIVGALLFVSIPNAVPAQDANRAVVIAPTDLGSVIDRVAKRSGDFKEEFDKEVEHTMDGKHVEERAKHRADNLHDSAKKLRDVFNDKKDKNDPRVREQVDIVLAAGSDVNRVMQDHRFTDKVQEDWKLLLGDLDALAAVYNLSPIG
jgi:hypothetical protein